MPRIFHTTSTMFTSNAHRVMIAVMKATLAYTYICPIIAIDYLVKCYTFGGVVLAGLDFDF